MTSKLTINNSPEAKYTTIKILPSQRIIQITPLGSYFEVICYCFSLLSNKECLTPLKPQLSTFYLAFYSPPPCSRTLNMRIMLIIFHSYWIVLKEKSKSEFTKLLGIYVQVDDDIFAVVEYHYLLRTERS